MGPRRGMVERHPGFGRGLVKPVAKAVAAEAADTHQIDILHIGARLEQRHEPAESRGLDPVPGRRIGGKSGGKIGRRIRHGEASFMADRRRAG